MAARKLQQEVDKCFKKVAEGVAEFEGIYEKIEQSNNPAQKEKLEDNLKREIKKLQRLRDQIKTWAASNDIKDKQPLLDQRRLIETQMEKFKAVEKAMKTKAYSKEGLSAAAKLDPKEQAKVETAEFLSSMVDELEQQIEAVEAESEQIQATSKKGKVSGAKAERLARIDEIIENHKWHQGKLERLGRHLENGGVEPEQVTELEEDIRYYVSDGMNDDYMYDEEMYDAIELEEEDGVFPANQDNDKGSSQDAHSVAEETPEPEPPKTAAKKAAKEPAESSASSSKKPSASKSPLPALATLHTPLSTVSNGHSNGNMKPASLPTRPAGEGLKYASAAAAAAAASDNVGISPLPPPPGITPPIVMQQAKKSVTNSPAITPARLATSSPRPASRAETKQQAAPAAPATATSSDNEMPAPVPKSTKRAAKQAAKAREAAASEADSSRANGQTNGIKPITERPEEEESVYHLPASLRDLVESHEFTAANPPNPLSASTHRQLTSSLQSAPVALDAEAPRLYTPSSPVPPTASNFPRQQLPIFDDPRLYGRIDPDTLFYVFYYKQGSPQQFLAAKALKDQSWRFHKQYQTWFQRHEEPKNITEEFEQGTYRFFDYESTWMNRRKADFKFAYKFLEDEV